MYIKHLSLLDFRNYESLELPLSPGVSVFLGANGQGKSNLLESIYMLCLTKSPRAEGDREVVRFQAIADGGLAQVTGLFQGSEGDTRVQMDLLWDASSGEGDGFHIKKRLRVNGIYRAASETVGRAMAVLFRAEDIEVVTGPPAERRRLLDVLLSLLDRRYLRSLQRFQAVLEQRNHLLRMMRDGQAQRGELDYWDGELCREGSYVLARRLEVAARLSALGRECYERLASGERMDVSYVSTIPLRGGEGEEDIRQSYIESLVSHHDKDVAAGATTVGPHRDDLRLRVEGKELSAYGSRGQARLAAVAVRLAEARVLHQARGEWPIVLMDDVFSELDPSRRRQVMGVALEAEQAIITAVEGTTLDDLLLERSLRFEIRSGRVFRVGQGPS
ncbi:MAG: DNA replication/repair protein RecF [Chloroflexi bacterium]|nr:DNA replication/repair protein RecF [Chloroflexota bacterium]